MLVNTLKDRHLKVLPMELDGLMMIKRNSTDSIVEMAGVLPLVLYWLANKYHFRYTILEIVAPLPDATPERRGAISYLEHGEADFILGAIIPLNRFSRLDFPTSFMEAPLSVLIPVPESTLNIAALVEPFQLLVWLLFLVAIAVVVVTLNLISRARSKLLDTDTINNAPFQSPNQTYKEEFKILSRVTEYVFGVLLSQGGVCYDTSLVTRAIAAAWCLGTFVLIQSYSTTLISYVSSPNVHPIINSVDEVPKKGLLVMVDRGFSLEAAFIYAEDGILKTIGDQLRAYPNELRCNVTAECLRKVLDGRHVYIQGAPVVQGLVDQDRKKTGKCHFTIAKESFWPSPIFLGLAKRSPYTEFISRGILILRENGLLYYWTDQYIPRPEECLNKYKEKPDRPRLTIRNLYSAFIILSAGYILSFIVFIFERFSSRRT